MHEHNLIEFVRANPIGVLSTLGEEGMASAAVYYMADLDGTIYFNTKRDSRKFQNLLKNPEVTFTAFQHEPAMTLQVKGVAEVVEDISQIEKTYAELLHRIFENKTIPPILQLGIGMVELVKITPTWMRLGSFSHDQNGDQPFTMIVG